MAKVNKKRGGKLFPKLRDPDFKRRVRANERCVLDGKPGHECRGRGEFCHLKSEGSGGPDRGNGFLGCSGAHRWDATCFHIMGVESFQAYWGVDLAAICAALDAKYPPNEEMAA